MTASHVYEREFTLDDDTSLGKLATRVPAGSRVLELGPGAGHFARLLHDSLRCTVDAVELDPVMAARARPWCRRLVEADLETADLAQLLGGERYDVIVAADVLEHLREPGRVLRALLPLLAADGRVLVSVPNVAYAGLIASLLDGRFEYTDEGLLDRTHLHFFTLSSLLGLADSGGLHPWWLHAVERPLGESEFRTRLESLPADVAALLQSAPGAGCYQWLAELRRAQAPEPPAVPLARLSDRFPLRVFWAAADEDFCYARSVVAWGRVGEARQTLSVTLPRAAAADRLRVRLADRAGFVRIHGIDVDDDASGWHWRAEQEALPAGLAHHGVTLTPGGDFVLVTVLEAESWIDLPWRAAQGAGIPAVRVVLGWPMSADYRLASNGWVETVDGLRAEIDALKALVATRDLEIAGRDARFEEYRLALEDHRAALEAARAELRETGDRLQHAHAALAALQEREAALQASAASLQQTVAEQGATIDGLRARLDHAHTFRWWLRRGLYWLGWR